MRCRNCRACENLRARMAGQARQSYKELAESLRGEHRHATPVCSCGWIETRPSTPEERRGRDTVGEPVLDWRMVQVHPLAVTER